ncbi:hypothetical protein KR009_011900 [Drosophila setifemur]|nr:hypothetical protein KR009_011900 [Drosophila setifemur]
MLIASIGTILICQVNLIAGQIYQVSGSPWSVQVISPSSQSLNFGQQPNLLSSLEQILSNYTLTANKTRDYQILSPFGSGNQNNGNAPLRNFLRNLFGVQRSRPNIRIVTLNGRAFSDRSQEAKYSKQYHSNTRSVQLPQTRVKVVRQNVPRWIVVRNLKSSQTQMTNVQTLRLPLYTNGWQVRLKTIFPLVPSL